MPLLLFLKDVDTGHKPMMGKIYYRMQCLTGDGGHFQKCTSEDYDGQLPLEGCRDKVLQLCGERWECFHSSVHAFAYCVNPRLQHMDHMSDAADGPG